MDTMSDSDTYQGAANRETWAFNLHWQNDQGLYRETLRVAEEYINTQEVGVFDTRVGEAVIDYWKDLIEEYPETFGKPVPAELEMFYREVGSWWRVDRKEVGAAVRESLDIESSD